MSRKFKILLASLLLGSLNSFAKPDTLANDSITYNPYPVDTIPEVNDTQLQDLVVEGSNLQHKGNLTTNIFSQEDFDRSHNAGELLGTTPGMNFDIITKELKYLNSTNLKLLVDGVSKDPSFIKTLDPNKYFKVEITSHPIGKYADYDAVVNLISRPDYSGVQFHILGAQVINPNSPFKQNRVFNATEGKGSFAMTYNKWTVEAFVEDTWERSGDNINQTITYPFNDLKWTYSKASDKRSDILSYSFLQNYYVTLGYEFNKNHKVSFQWNMICNHSKDNALINFLTESLSSQKINSEKLNTNTKKLGNNNYFVLYYTGHVKNWNLYSEFLYNFGNSKNFYSRNYSSSEPFTNNLKYNSKYFSGVLNASKSFLNNSLNLSLYEDFFSYYLTSRDYENSISSAKSLNFSNSLFASLGYYPNNKLGFSLSAGFNINYLSEQNFKRTHINPRADAMFSWQPHKNFFARINYSLSSSLNGISNTQDFGYFTDELLYFHGNPELKPQIRNSISMNLNFFNSFNVGVYYTKFKNGGASIYLPEYGLRPDETNGYFVSKTMKNIDTDQFTLYMSYSGKFNKHWFFNVNANLLYLNSSYQEFKNKGWFPSGGPELMYLWNNSLLGLLRYGIGSQGTLSPQTCSRTILDKIELLFQKTLLANRFVITMAYTLPVHILSGKSTTTISSAPYISETISFKNPFINNQFILQLEYNFHKGDEIKQNMKNIRKID